MEKFSNSEAGLKKALLIKKAYNMQKINLKSVIPSRNKKGLLKYDSQI